MYKRGQYKVTDESEKEKKEEEKARRGKDGGAKPIRRALLRPDENREQ